MAKHVEVVGAVIVRAGKVLCAQRGLASALGGKWEFPGGKVEPGEEPRDALKRELVEELGCAVVVGELVTTTTYEYEFATVTLTTFICALESGEPKLTEHEAIVWLAPDELDTLEWAPADLPAVELLVHGAAA